MAYHRAWLDALDYSHKQYQHPPVHPQVNNYSGQCNITGMWEKVRLQVAVNLGTNPGTLRDLQVVFEQSEKPLERCVPCLNHLRNWRYLIQSQVNGLPKFNTLLDSL
jgi:hypothetical protein